jgi:hypothetical protein
VLRPGGLKLGDADMSAIRDVLDVVRDERDAILPFFDSFAQLGSAYDDLERMVSGVAFHEALGALPRQPGKEGRGRKLDELTAARGRLLHLAMAFAAERKEGKWPEMLKPESQEAVRRLDAAIEELGAG